MNKQRLSQGGSVSLFIVIFVALLIITISTAFIRIMIQDQLQATANDLSKSALDSANAGVEDAKRAIVEYYNPDTSTGKPDCSTIGQGVNTRCDALRIALFADVTSGGDGWTEGCHATVDAGVASLNDGEVLVKTSNSDDDQLNQAYTCLKIQMNPSEVLASLEPGVSKVIPLKSKDGVPFTQIKFRWYKKQQGQPIELDKGLSSLYELPDEWPANRPPVIRAQLLQYQSEFQLSDFNKDSNFNSSLFLLPSIAGASATAKTAFILDKRQDATSQSAQPVACNQTATTGNFVCEVVIDLPGWGDPLYAGSRNAYLKLSQFYSWVKTPISLSMLTSDNKEVRLEDVQVAVDSTGRANSMFRRIQSRIDLGTSSVPYPEAAVDVTKSLCKEFLITTENAYPGNSSICPAPPTN